MEIAWIVLSIMSVMSIIFYIAMGYHARIAPGLPQPKYAIYMNRADLLGRICQITMTISSIIFIILCVLDFPTIQEVFSMLMMYNLSRVNIVRFCVFLLNLCVFAYSGLKWIEVLCLTIIIKIENKKTDY